MADNTKSDQKPFIKELVVEMFRHELLRTSFLFLFRPHAFFNAVKANNWDGKLHPAAFLLASLAIVALLNPFIAPQWYESLGEMDDERGLEFLEAFPFTEQELETMWHEAFVPGKTPASRRIEETVGSLKVIDIALHLAESNPRVTQALMRGANEIEKYDRYFGYITSLIIILSWAICALVIHLILRRNSEPYRLAFFLMIYFQGFWIMFSYLTVAFGRFVIPFEFSLLSLLFVLVEAFAVVASFIHGCWICGFVYKRGIGRRLLAFVPAYAAVLATFFVFSKVLTLVVDWLP